MKPAERNPKIMNQRLRLALLVAALLLHIQTAFAQDRAERLAERYGQTAAQEIFTEQQQLVAKAEKQGVVPVIVELVMSPVDLAHSAADDVNHAQLQLESAQARVIRSLSAFRLRGEAAMSLKRFKAFPGFSLHADLETLKELLDNPDVLRVTEDKSVPPMLFQSVPLIGADTAGTFNGYTGEGQVVAVLDTGVQTDHPFLAGKTVSEACYSTNNAEASLSSLCPGGATSSTVSGSGYNCDSSLTSGCSHGTHVAGIVLGTGGNYDGASFSGVAKGANLIAI